MSILDIFKRVNELPPVKLFVEAFEALEGGKSTSVSRSALQKKVKDEGKKSAEAKKAIEEAVKTDGKDNSDNRVRTLANEGLSHTSRLAKIDRALERLQELKKAQHSSIDSIISALSNKQAKREKDGNIDSYKKEHRASTFKDVSQRLKNGSDGRRLGELKISHNEQAAAMQKKLIVDPQNPDDTVGDYLADERILEALNTRKGSKKSTDEIIDDVSNELKEESQKIHRRQLFVTARMLHLSK